MKLLQPALTKLPVVLSANGKSVRHDFDLDELRVTVAAYVCDHRNCFELDQSAYPVLNKSDWWTNNGLRHHLRAGIAKLETVPREISDAAHDTLSVTPEISCFVVKGQLALRINYDLSLDAAQTMFPKLESKTNLEITHWSFVSVSRRGWEFRDFDPQHIVISPEGVIGRNNCEIHPSHPGWPEAAWNFTGEMKAYSILADLTRSSESNPLTSLIKSGHPYRGHALQVTQQLDIARAALR